MTLTSSSARRKRVGAAAVIVLTAPLLSTAACGTAPRGRVEMIAVAAPSLQPSLIQSAPTQPAVVILPPGYHETTKSYPVVYYLPGFITDVTEYVDGSIAGFRLGDTLDELVRRQAIAEMVVVIVNGRNGLGGSFYVNSPVTGRAEDHLLADLLPHVESRYRVAHDRSRRGIAGDGMGGFGALNLAMRHPDVFGAVFAINPALFDEHGLEDAGMLSAPFVKAWFIQLQRMRNWPREEAAGRLVNYTRELYAADGSFATFRGYALAYAAAFAPNPDAGPPFADWPYRDEGGRVMLDPAVTERLSQGIGGWTDKVRSHRGAWASLRGIGINVGRDNANAWIPRGGRRLAQLLGDAGIHRESTEHDGDNFDGFDRRIADVMLPFFSRVLGAGGAAAAPARPQEPRHD